MQKPALEDPERTRLIVQRFLQRGEKKGTPEIGKDGRTYWGIQNEDKHVVAVFKGDVLTNAYLYTDTGHHPDVYIEGKVGEDAEVPSRECEILSAHSLGKNAQVGGRILILGDEPLSRLSVNFKSGWKWPLILVVPENQRASVFNHMMDIRREQPWRIPSGISAVDEYVQALDKILKECGVSNYRFFSAGRCVETSPD